ncbi:PTS system N,N'-diacetylchitobiose-specific IIB component (Lac family) [Propionicimonas paludicola]|uniref:PTS system N,N'-diacetylchitobiose-specific IIB component (Lac family) n=1 Tax=Propionicimonas paludicola TaxID=185243 RepID=A0A2A9CTL5_9ACTN|nr:PTS lactose transporter subunit IIBC [Propionicimonas paludicola]PFG17774.1 PTS system N,N'-diacetylchitobiose-specific IIB component (Lac family) [Propionicimonas paludicola]
MKILLICGNGVSSGMIARKIAQAGVASGATDTTSEAYSYAQLGQVVDQFDVVLAAPQMRSFESMIQKACATAGKPYAILDDMTYAMLDGNAGFNVAQAAVSGGVR